MSFNASTSLWIMASCLKTYHPQLLYSSDASYLPTKYQYHSSIYLLYKTAIKTIVSGGWPMKVTPRPLTPESHAAVVLPATYSLRRIRQLVGASSVKVTYFLAILCLPCFLTAASIMSWMAWAPLKEVARTGSREAMGS